MVLKIIRSLQILIIALLLTSSLHAEINLSNWRSYGSMLDISSATMDWQGRVWAGSKGGIFVCDTGTYDLTVYNYNNGLLSMQVTALATDSARHQILSGTYDGFIDIYNEADGWKNITDIVSNQYPNPQIFDIIIHDTVAYIAAGFGITAFDLTRDVFLETSEQLGNFEKNSPVYDIMIYDNMLWAASDAGIATIDIDSYKRDPGLWKNYTSSDGLPNEPIYGMAAVSGQVYAHTDTVIYEFDGTVFVGTDTLPTYNQVKNMYGLNGDLYYSTYNRIYKNREYITESSSSLLNGSLSYLADGQVRHIGMTSQEGIAFVFGQEFETVYPNSPRTNMFRKMQIDEQGRLWVATRRESGSRDGFMMYDGDQWYNFSTDNYEEIPTDVVYMVSTLSDGSVWFGTHGRGGMLVSDADSGFSIVNYSNTNTALEGYKSGSNYVITGQALLDNSGVLWITNYGEGGALPVLIAEDQEGNFYTFNNCTSESKRGFGLIIEDLSGTKWIGSIDANNPPGLMYFNEGGPGSLANTDDDICGVLTSSNSSIMNNEQTALAMDQNGFLWIATPEGLCVMYNPSSVTYGSSPIIRDVRAITSQYIYDVMVDAVNNKWVATNKGIWVLNTDGTEVIDIITKDKYPLPTDKIKSLAQSPDNGDIYIGTDLGLTIVNSTFIRPNPEYDIKCYPSPFKIAQHENMTIEGLARESEVRILTVNGELIRKIKTSSRTVLWDGRDENNKPVSTGIYIVSASSEGNTASQAVKIAVMNK